MLIIKSKFIITTNNLISTGNFGRVYQGSLKTQDGYQKVAVKSTKCELWLPSFLSVSSMSMIWQKHKLKWCKNATKCTVLNLKVCLNFKIQPVVSLTFWNPLHMPHER